jgi:carboxyl-terminal processing protease
MKSNRSRLFFVLASVLALLLLMALKGPILAPGRDPAAKALAIFTEVLNLTRSNYVEPVEISSLLDGAYDGVTDAIDPFSYYVPPDKMAKYRAFKASNALDAGLVLGRRLGAPYVVAAVPGSPAEAAGLRSGDVILAVDGATTRNQSLWEVEAQVSGPEGTTVKVKVIRSGDEKESEFSVVRRPYQPSAPTGRTEETIPVFRIPAFARGSASRLKEELEKLSGKPPAVIVDLRDSAAGEVEEAARAASLFVPSGAVAKLSGKKVPTRELSTQGSRVWEGKAILLVDGGTGGPAEVFAGALADRAKAVLVGETTAGMGIQQKLIAMPSGGALYLTIAQYTTPSGTEYTGKGLKPSVRVDLFPDDTAQGRDPILKRAIELARGDSAKPAA